MKASGCSSKFLLHPRGRKASVTKFWVALPPVPLYMAREAITFGQRGLPTIWAETEVEVEVEVASEEEDDEGDFLAWEKRPRRTRIAAGR